MQLGFIGLGRMGANMVLRLLEKGHDCVVTDTNESAVRELAAAGATAAKDAEELAGALHASRIVWLMVPRHAVDAVLDELIYSLSKGDIVIDGGNSYYEDSIRRAETLAEKGIYFLDVGVSGGVEGARTGACTMAGGDRKAYESVEPLLRDLSVAGGYGYMGSSGAGHFVKMVHNAIEYGMMGAIAEGMQAIGNERHRFGTDLGEVVKVYGHGSIIAGRLISEWLAAAWSDDPELASLDEEVPYGETEEEMEKLEKKKEMPVLAAAREMRVVTRAKPSFAGKVINALRFQFGGHTKETASKKSS